MTIAGTSGNSNTPAVDGVVSNDAGMLGVFSSVSMLDAMGEAKVVVNSYQAEYAGNGGVKRPRERGIIGKLGRMRIRQI